MARISSNPISLLILALLATNVSAHSGVLGRAAGVAAGAQATPLVVAAGASPAAQAAPVVVPAGPVAQKAVPIAVVQIPKRPSRRSGGVRRKHHHADLRTGENAAQAAILPEGAIGEVVGEQIADLPLGAAAQVKGHVPLKGVDKPLVTNAVRVAAVVQSTSASDSVASPRVAAVIQSSGSSAIVSHFHTAAMGVTATLAVALALL